MSGRPTASAGHGRPDGGTMSQESYDGIRYREEKSSPLVFRILFLALVAWAIPFMFVFLTGGWSSEGEYARHREERNRLKEQVQAKETSTPEAVPMPAAAAGGGATTGPAGSDPPPAVAAAAPAPVAKGDLAEGKKIYAERCAACHGDTGKGEIGPDLTKNLKYGRTEKGLTVSIAEGRDGGMPGFANELSSDQISSLVRFILSLK